MKRREFLKVSAGTAASVAVASSIFSDGNLFPTLDKKIQIYFDRNFSQENSLVFTQIRDLLDTFNSASDFKVELVHAATDTFLKQRSSFISSPDYFKFSDSIVAGFANLTFLGRSRTYQDKIKDVESERNGFSQFMGRAKLRPLFISVGPDLQAEIIRIDDGKRFAVYDFKSSLYCSALKATPVTLDKPIEAYFDSFHTHFDATAPLEFKEFFGSNGFKISKSLIRIDHKISPKVCALFLSESDSIKMGDSNLKRLQSLANEKLASNSAAINQQMRDALSS